ncbi:MAG TPA: AAA family ATPase, partial [Chloroflexota bacterium]
MPTTAPSFAGRIEPPLPPRNHVARPRLREALDAAVPHSVTLVVAPAGFGKTVALADFARTAEFPVAWLSMVSADADVVTFADTLVRAVQRAVPGFGERVLQIVRRAGGRAVEVLAAELADELAERGGPIGLVLDDFHAVDPDAKETADAVRLVDLLLERAPPNLFVLIGSRTLPALRHADFASAGRLHGVAAEELRFTPAEVAEWLGVEPSDRRAAEAYDRTQGWAAALLLGGVALPGDALAGYLKREIWDGLEPEARRFFLRAAVPATLTADLCRDVLGEPKGPLYLEDARQSSLFVAALPSGQWRLHDLFRDFLR